MNRKVPCCGTVCKMCDVDFINIKSLIVHLYERNCVALVEEVVEEEVVEEVLTPTQKMLRALDFKVATAMDMAKHVGFNDKEMEMMEVFWTPCFNEEKMLFAREDIKEYFGKDGGRNAVNHFEERVLRKHFEEGVDYDILTLEEYNSLLLKFEEQNKDVKTCSSNLTSRYETVKGGGQNVEETESYYPNLGSKIKDVKTCAPKMGSRYETTNGGGGHNTKFYALTGETIKQIGMMKNRAVRDYYIKLESLCKTMVKYNHALTLHEKDKEVNAIKYEVLKRFELKPLPPKAGHIYIVSTKNYAKQDIYKVGRTKNNVSKRVGNLNTGHVKDDSIKTYHSVATYNDNKVESIIHHLLDSVRITGDREWMSGNFEWLKSVVDREVSAYNNIVEEVHKRSIEIEKIKFKATLEGKL
jgi:hypothetical protein